MACARRPSYDPDFFIKAVTVSASRSHEGFNIVRLLRGTTRGRIAVTHLTFNQSAWGHAIGTDQGVVSICCKIKREAPTRAWIKVGGCAGEQCFFMGSVG